MKELLDTYLPSWITGYVYLPYMFAVWLIVEWIRYQFDGIDGRIKPKHLTAITGIFVGIACYFGEKHLENETIPVWMLVLSYFFTTFIYEYGIKLIKEKIPFFQKFAEKQKQ